ncbi:MAG TPA: hypothetical protein VGH20_06680 [Myxococcales bacterium]
MEQTRVAFTEAVARMFTPKPTPDLELELAVETAEIFEQVQGGFVLDIEARIRVLTPEGALLDAVHAVGRRSVTADTAVDRAALEAARVAARDFEEKYDRSSAIRAWLVSSGVASASAVALPPRSRQLFWIAPVLGVGTGGDKSMTVIPAVRVGASWNWLMLQAMYAHHGPDFTAALLANSNQLSNPVATLSTNDFGLEIGGVLRPWESIELRAGPGVHYLFGSASTDPAEPGQQGSESYSKLSPTLFASISTTFLPFRNGARFVVGAEARVYFSSSTDLAELGRRVPLLDNSFGLFLGIEAPWKSSRGGTR